MKPIKHYSFDLWLTLIKSNPNFKKQRVLYVHEHYNSLGKTQDEVEAVFRQVDLMCNTVNEQSGKNIDADEMYLMVLYQLNDDFAKFNSKLLETIQREIEILLFENMPLIYSEETYKTLESIRNQEDVSMSILSNTAFIQGKSLRKVLKHHDLDRFFDFQLYSDELGLSKPNPFLFDLLFDEVKKHRKDLDISRAEILHIGDNPKADVWGAEQAGFQSALINSNDKRITDLFQTVCI